MTRVGVIVGGTRVERRRQRRTRSATTSSRPFAYNTCADRDSDGLIATSRGLGDIRPWTNAGGVDDNGGVTTAADECLINYTRVAGTNTRTVAVDANNDVWTGGSNTEHEKVDGVHRAAVVPGTPFNLGCGGYGGLIDKAGTLWSARYGTNLLRYVPGTAPAPAWTPRTATTASAWTRSPARSGTRRSAATGWSSSTPDGTVLGTFPHGNAERPGRRGRPRRQRLGGALARPARPRSDTCAPTAPSSAT